MARTIKWNMEVGGKMNQDDEFDRIADALDLIADAFGVTVPDDDDEDEDKDWDDDDEDEDEDWDDDDDSDME